MKYVPLHQEKIILKILKINADFYKTKAKNYSSDQEILSKI